MKRVQTERSKPKTIWQLSARADWILIELIENRIEMKSAQWWTNTMKKDHFTSHSKFYEKFMGKLWIQTHIHKMKNEKRNKENLSRFHFRNSVSFDIKRHKDRSDKTNIKQTQMEHRNATVFIVICQIFKSLIPYIPWLKVIYTSLLLLGDISYVIYHIYFITMYANSV